MTKELNDIDPHDALYKAAKEYPGKIPALAGRVMINPKTLYNKLDPDVRSHHITYEEFSEIIEKLDAERPAAADLAIGALMWRHNRVAIRLPQAGSVDADLIMQEMLELLHEEGQLANDINKALMDDNEIDDPEFDRIDKDLQRIMETVATLREEVKLKHERDMANKRRG